MNDRLAAWEFIAKQKVSKAFTELNESGIEYQVAYAEVLEAINEKLLSNRFSAAGRSYKHRNVSVWAESVQNIFEGIPDSLNSMSSSFNLFWQGVLQLALAYACVAIALRIVGVLFSSVMLNVAVVLLAGGALLAGQAEYALQQFLKATKQEFIKYLPRLAEEQWESIHRSVKGCFDTFEHQAMERINLDIASRRAELNNLLAQKESHEIDREQEISRLRTLEKELAVAVEGIEARSEGIGFLGRDF